MSGSSPRVRGTLRNARLYRGGERFIPACAGNAVTVALFMFVGPVHPRVCGERRPVRRARGLSGGSSPRVRGTLGGFGRRVGTARFIPACAGNAVLRCLDLRNNTVHPRVCGERTQGPVPGDPPHGSSPRVRGTPPSRARGCPCRRFIPACAGNADGVIQTEPHPAVHPRVCGERRDPRGADGRSAGSSPRVRGTPPISEFAPDDGRFIPACAGNAPTPRPLASTSTVHPRVCGERDLLHHALQRGFGSSPRVRGTLRVLLLS